MSQCGNVSSHVYIVYLLYHFRFSKWNKSYSGMSTKQAEGRLGFRLHSLKEIPIKAMLEHAERVSLDEAKEEVYKEIKRYLRVPGISIVKNLFTSSANKCLRFSYGGSK